MTAKVLKDWRLPRHRGRMGTTVNMNAPPSRMRAVRFHLPPGYCGSVSVCTNAFVAYSGAPTAASSPRCDASGFVARASVSAMKSGNAAMVGTPTKSSFSGGNASKDPSSITTSSPRDVAASASATPTSPRHRAATPAFSAARSARANGDAFHFGSLGLAET